jgi:D-threo-aldose 1-dehydrogenase
MNMTTLKRRKVGKTKLEVTELGLGGAPMGGFRATIPDAEAVKLTDDGYDAGIRFFDTSPYYGYGRSELRMGAALREKPRDSYVLSTKIGRIMHAMKPGEKPPADFRENGLPGFAPVYDYTYDGVMRSLEHSHMRLGLQKIDIALIHDVDFWTTKDRAVLEERFKTVMDGGYRALDELRKAGVISAIGVGINESDTSTRFIKAGDFDCMLLAGRYTLLEQGALEEFLPECTKRHVSVILGGPYNSGILTGNVKAGASYDYVAAPVRLIEKAQKIEAICQRHGVPLGAAAMQFPLFHPAFCSVIPGALSVVEVKQNVAHMSVRIPVELWSELKREKLLDPAAPTPN